MPLSEKHKKKLSEGRKKWLKENPDKHPWRSHNKFKSKPCEKAKEFLRSLGISFIEEYDPQIEGRNFSIDIAMPEKKIAIEINGNQHYEKTGELKPYYKERELLLESKGWIVYEIHYSACFKLEKWADFVNQLKNSPVKVEFDYFTYVPKEKNKWFCGCGKERSYGAIMCMICKAESRRKAVRPTKEELEKLVLEFPLTKIGKQFGVSDNAIRNWCKTYGIENLPKNDYRQKQFHSNKN